MQLNEEQSLLYTVGKIDASVSALGEQMTRGFERLERKLDTEIAGLHAKVDKIENRVEVTEKYQEKQSAQMRLVGGVAGVVGALISAIVFLITGVKI